MLKIIDLRTNKVYAHQPDTIEKGIGRAMLQKYPGGKWVTMQGRHVYITKDGKPSPETDPRKHRSADIRGKARRLYDAPADGIQTGSIYRYGNSLVLVDKIGDNHVTITDAKGNKRKVLKTKFAQNADKEAGGKNNVQDLKEMAQETPKQEAPARGTAGKVGAGVAGQEPSADTKDAKGTGEGTTGGSEKTRTTLAQTTPKALRAKGFEIQTGFNGDEAYDVYDAWDKHSDRAKTYFRIKMVQFGDVPPERLEQYGIVLRKITKGGEVAGLMQLQDHPTAHSDGGGVVEVGHAEIAPHMRKGHGLGTQIIANAIAESYDRGYGGRIFLKSHSDAIGFYKKLGMNWIGGQYNIFDFTSEQAQAFYEHVTGEKLGEEVAKSIGTELTPEGSKRPSPLPSLEELQRAEDKLYPVGLLVGDFAERMKSQTAPKYKTKEVDLFEE